MILSKMDRSHRTGKGVRTPVGARQRDGCTDTIRSFWVTSVLSPIKEFYDVEENKCEVCGKEFKRSQDLKTHKTHSNHHYDQLMQYSGKSKDEAIMIKKEEAQEKLSTAKWGDEPAKN